MPKLRKFGECQKNNVKIKKIDTNSYTTPYYLYYYIILYYIIFYVIFYIVFIFVINKEKEKRETEHNLREFLNDLLLGIPIE